jgi:hypothetical protein
MVMDAEKLIEKRKHQFGVILNWTKESHCGSSGTSSTSSSSDYIMNSTTTTATTATATNESISSPKNIKEEEGEENEDNSFHLNNSDINLSIIPQLNGDKMNENIDPNFFDNSPPHSPFENITDLSFSIYDSLNDSNKTKNNNSNNLEVYKTYKLQLKIMLSTNNNCIRNQNLFYLVELLLFLALSFLFSFSFSFS